MFDCILLIISKYLLSYFEKNYAKQVLRFRYGSISFDK